MGINQDFCINNSGRSYPVYDDTKGLVGTLYNRESFIKFGSEGCYTSIVFLGPNGGLVDALVNTYTYPLQYCLCTEKPYGEDQINEITYKTFIMRRSKTIYRPDGTSWGTVAANMLVATNNPDVGSSHVDWKEINYVQQSPNRNWIQVSGNGYNHGFVDTGLSTSSGYSSIPFYGSW